MGVILLGVASVAVADSRVKFTGNFETGEVQPKRDSHDGFFVKTLPNPQSKVSEVSITSGGAGPRSGLDTRVVATDAVDNQIVRPRSGRYFLRSAIYRDKDYSEFKGNGGKNKPRSSIGINAHKFDYDTEGYLGFSIFVPKKFENETGRKGEQGKSMVLTVGAPGAETFYNLNIWVPPAGSEAHWYLRLQLNPHSVKETHPATRIENIDLGSVRPDRGMWTDFVVRFRSNPFSRDTNPARQGINGAQDKRFQGNKGILQVWKAEGSPDRAGNRSMVLKVNKVNTPVGLVPHKRWKLDTSFRIYKHGWHHQPTSVRGPVWLGFDEIRLGLTGRDGTRFEDVHPTGRSCTHKCPRSAS